jgi:hypothetical protein
MIDCSGRIRRMRLEVGSNDARYWRMGRGGTRQGWHGRWRIKPGLGRVQEQARCLGSEKRWRRISLLINFSMVYNERGDHSFSCEQESSGTVPIGNRRRFFILS